MILLTGLALLTAACAGDEASDSGSLSDQQVALADMIRDNLAVDDPAAPASLEQEDVDCAADSVAAAFSDERIAELGLDSAAAAAGLDTAALTAEERAAVTGALDGCIDFDQLIVETATAGGEISEESVTCIADAVPEEFYQDVQIALALGSDTDQLDQTDVASVTESLFGCLSAEELSQLGG
jgi:hypothetical protein